MFGKQEKQIQVDLEVYTIFDSKTRMYDKPLFEVNGDVLQREVVTLFTKPERENNRYYTNAEDFAIFKIGSYEKKSGTLISHPPEHLANMNDLRALAARQTRPSSEMALSPT